MHHIPISLLHIPMLFVAAVSPPLLSLFCVCEWPSRRTICLLGAATSCVFVLFAVVDYWRYSDFNKWVLYGTGPDTISGLSRMWWAVLFLGFHEFLASALATLVFFLWPGDAQQSFERGQ
jgi:hypothetical protein